MGRFELAFMDQLDVVELPSSSEEYDLPKIDMTPRVLRDRSKQPVSARQRGYGEPSPPDAQDEAIVNSALVNFLHAIWIDESRESNWTPQRKALKFESRSGGVGFTARTDGHLKVQSFNDRSAAILEVKARARPRGDPANHNIAMQESAQMALWIAQEPDNHWTGPNQEKRTKGKQVKSQTKFYRILVSQDRTEIYMTIAEYTQTYIDYLHKKNNVTIEDDFDLSMKMFGAFEIDNPNHMLARAGLIKVLLTYAAEAVMEAIRRSHAAERADPFKDLKDIAQPLDEIETNRERDQSPSARQASKKGKEPKRQQPPAVITGCHTANHEATALALVLYPEFVISCLLIHGLDDQMYLGSALNT